MNPETGRLERMLTRLKLTTIRDQLEALLDKACQRDFSLRESLTFLGESKVARKDQRRIAVGMSTANFSFVRGLQVC